MLLRELLQKDESLWPDAEYRAAFEGQKDCFSASIRDLVCEEPFFHGWLLKEITYSNPLTQSQVNPSIVVNLEQGGRECSLAFAYVLETEMQTPASMDVYHPFVEETLKAYILMHEGCVEFICRFASELKLYIRSSGVHAGIVEETPA